MVSSSSVEARPGETCSALVLVLHGLYTGGGWRKKTQEELIKIYNGLTIFSDLVDLGRNESSLIRMHAPHNVMCIHNPSS